MKSQPWTKDRKPFRHSVALNSEKLSRYNLAKSLKFKRGLTISEASEREKETLDSRKDDHVNGFYINFKNSNQNLASEDYESPNAM